MKSKKIIIFISILIFSSASVMNAQNYLQHSVGLDFGPTLFSMGTMQLITGFALKPKETDLDKRYNGKFGMRFTYNYTYLPKQSIDVQLGFYLFDIHYSIADKVGVKYYDGGVSAVPASIGVRFYFNKSDTPSGFFLLPKVGFTSYIINSKEVLSDGSILNKKTSITDFYISGEMGFRIDLFSKMGANWKARPFIDISLLEFGYSFTPGIRFIPLPRLAVGVSF